MNAAPSSGSDAGPAEASAIRQPDPDSSSAATGDQLELVPIERCDYCGPLEWTKGRYGRVTHKHGCPNRSDTFCQAHPAMCGDPVKPVKNPGWPLTALRGETWEDLFPATQRSRA